MIRSGKYECPLACVTREWRWLHDPTKDTLVLLHPCGLWVEFDRDCALELSPLQAASVGRALRTGVRTGATGYRGVVTDERSGVAVSHLRQPPPSWLWFKLGAAQGAVR